MRRIRRRLSSSAAPTPSTSTTPLPTTTTTPATARSPPSPALLKKEQKRLQEIADAIPARFLELTSPTHSSKWNEVYHDRGGVSLQTKQIQGFHYDAFLSRTDFARSATEVVDKLWDFRKEWVGLMDPKVISWEILFEFSPTLRLCRQVQQMPWPLHNRELLFLSARITEEESGREYVVFQSVDTELAKPLKGLVRMDVFISVWMAKPTSNPNACTFSRLLHVDPHANVPKFTVNAASENCAAQLRTLKGIFEPKAKL
eukprot:TRINITY_DN10476_c0_g1_i1.p1 TRINITY_DN10476_c0_g1~~TRINITY_DN10476_c0_g1_i1.p1  ORF type:complete len:258 (+),score=40.16 TRINITY_DN10476_c0_g1_i1:1-774(+)